MVRGGLVAKRARKAVGKKGRQLWPVRFVARCRYGHGQTFPMSTRWAIEFMEERFERTTQTPQELRARGEELRAQAAETDIVGYREAALALADRYEEAAAARIAST